MSQSHEGERKTNKSNGKLYRILEKEETDYRNLN